MRESIQDMLLENKDKALPLLIYRKALIFFFSLLILWSCTQLSDAAGSEPVFSLEANRMPLGQVLKRISSLSGCEVTANDSWLDVPVTVSLTNVTLERALERVLSSLGNPNHVAVTKGNKVELLICASAGENPEIRNRETSPDSNISTSEEAHARLLDSFLDEEAPTGDEPGLFLSQTAIDPLDLEVIPPEKPGARGITERELIAMDQRQRRVDPLDLEVIPSEKLGEKGITERELIAMLGGQKQVDPLELEVIPPERLGEKGITERELMVQVGRK